MIDFLIVSMELIKVKEQSKGDRFIKSIMAIKYSNGVSEYKIGGDVLLCRARATHCLGVKCFWLSSNEITVFG